MPVTSRPSRRPNWRRRAPVAVLTAAVLAGGGAALLAAGPAAAGTTSASTAAAGASAPTAPPPVTILTRASKHSKAGGDFFISPYGDQTTYANGPEILSPDGKVLWFKAVPAGEEASDFRVQTYDGRPVLTWWQGTGLGGLSQGTDYIYNDHYQQIAAVNAGNGYSADGHEFLITPWNTALILSYATATANLTSIGGPADQTVIDGIVQEIDIKTGKVLFQWNSADHVPYSESEQPLPASASTPWDWFHINAVKVVSDGSILIDARDAWTAYDVSLRTGNINWQLGGKDSTFTEVAAPGQVLDAANEIFAWQHDPQQVGPDTYTFFDNESAGTPELSTSRVVTVRLNFATKVATLVSSIDQPEGQVAASQGNAQTTPAGNVVVGWGALPYFSEFSKSGTLLFNAEFPAGVNTYRAYQFPWPPQPGRAHQRR
jgi:Arylsulfotransferase (ASST)